MKMKKRKKEMQLTTLDLSVLLPIPLNNRDDNVKTIN